MNTPNVRGRPPYKHKSERLTDYMEVSAKLGILRLFALQRIIRNIEWAEPLVLPYKTIRAFRRNPRYSVLSTPLCPIGYIGGIRASRITFAQLSDFFALSGNFPYSERQGGEFSDASDFSPRFKFDVSIFRHILNPTRRKIAP